MFQEKLTKLNKNFTYSWIDLPTIFFNVQRIKMISQYNVVGVKSFIRLQMVEINAHC